MRIRRGLAVWLGVLIAVAAWPIHAQQRNNTDRRQQQQPISQRPPQEQADVDALGQFIDAHQMSDPALPQLQPAAPAPGAAAAAAAPITAPPAAKPEFTLTWEKNHFIRSNDGTTFVPYTLKIDRTALPAKSVAYFVRLVDQETAAAYLKWYTAMATAAQAPPATSNRNNNRNSRDANTATIPIPLQPRYAWQSAHFIDLPDGDTVTRAFQVPPGKYVAFIAVKERTPPAAPAPPAAGGNQRNNRNQNQAPAAVAPAAPPKIGLLRKEIEIPNYTTSELQTSSVLLASAIEPLQSQLSLVEQEASPYVIGTTKISLSEGKFPKSGEVNVLFWVYGYTNAATGKPDLSVEYMFHVKQGAADKPFTRTAPQAYDATTLPPGLKATDPIGVAQGVPASAFPAGDYRLEIKVTDKPSGKTITQNVNFTVLPV